MNTKIKQLDESIEKSELKLQELERNFLKSFSMAEAYQITEIRKSIRKLKQDREDLINQSFIDQTGDPMSGLGELFKSFNPLNNN